jgi:murein DD-endopeptidase MepM/ murein hydrolase activator NlpD
MKWVASVLVCLGVCAGCVGPWGAATEQDAADTPEKTPLQEPVAVDDEATAVVEVTTTQPPATTLPNTTVPTTTVLPTTTSTTTLPVASEYVFPFAGREVSYPRDHHTYPAVDVFGCGALVLAPTSGIVNATRTEDLWDPATNNPAHRGGLYVSMIGDDGVRYYFSHFETVAVEAGERVNPGDVLGVMGQTGNARNSVCHTHFGISRVCPELEWQVRRGEIWPQPYMDDWRRGISSSPALEIMATAERDPDACARAAVAANADEA